MKMKKNRMAIVLCCLIVFFSAGCAEMQEAVDSLNRAGPGQPYSWLTDEERAADARRPKIVIDSDDSYWQMEHEKEKLRRLEEEARLDTTRINNQTRKMLYEMELQRKLKELERQREMQRRR